MQSIEAWAGTHPFLMTAVVWPVVTLIINAIFDWAKAHESESKAVRFFDAALSAAGLDAGKFIAALKALLAPSPPPPASGGSDSKTRDTIPPPARRPSVMRRGAAVATLGIALSCGPTGCSVLHDAIPVIDKVLTYLADVEEILSIVESAATVFFAQHPDLATQREEYVKRDTQMHLALDTVVRLAHAGKDLDDEQMVRALRDCQEAYKALSQLLVSLGVHLPSGRLGAPTGAAPAPLPQPLLMSLHAEST